MSSGDEHDSALKANLRGSFPAVPSGPVERKAGLAIRRGVHRVTGLLENLGHRGTEAVVVIDQQDSGHGLGVRTKAG